MLRVVLSKTVFDPQPLLLRRPRSDEVISRDNSFHEQRRLQLQVWLQAIVADPACTLADELLHFLGVPRADLDVRGGQEQRVG